MITNLWANPLLESTDAEHEYYRQSLIEAFYSMKDEIPNQAQNDYITTVGGYQPNYDILAHESEDVNALVADVLDPIAVIFWEELIKHNPLIPRNIKFNHKSWFVEYETGGYQNLHMHKQSFFTNIWFLDIGQQKKGCGELHLQNPNPGSFLLGFEPPVKKIIPQTGSIITIPSWIQHNVTPTSDRRLVFVWDTTVMPA